MEKHVHDPSTCDHGECLVCQYHGDLDRAIEHIKAQIEEYGVSVMAIYDGGPPYAYTVGMTKRGLPEGIIIGEMPPETAQHWLNHLFTNAKTVVEGPVEVEAQYPQIWELVEVEDQYQEYANMVRNIYGDDFRLMQVCYPDKDGKFPWEGGKQLYPVLPRKKDQ